MQRPLNPSHGYLLDWTMSSQPALSLRPAVWLRHCRPLSRSPWLPSPFLRKRPGLTIPVFVSFPSTPSKPAMSSTRTRQPTLRRRTLLASGIFSPSVTWCRLPWPERENALRLVRGSLLTPCWSSRRFPPRQAQKRVRGPGGPPSNGRGREMTTQWGAHLTTHDYAGTGVSLPCTVNWILTKLHNPSSSFFCMVSELYPPFLCHLLFRTSRRIQSAQGDRESHKKVRWVILTGVGPPTSPKFFAPDRETDVCQGTDQPPLSYRRISDPSGFPRAWSYTLRTHTCLVLPVIFQDWSSYNLTFGRIRLFFPLSPVSIPTIHAFVKLPHRCHARLLLENSAEGPSGYWWLIRLLASAIYVVAKCRHIFIFLIRFHRFRSAASSLM